MTDHMSHDELALRLTQLEAKVIEDEQKIKPLVDIYNWGKMTGRALFFVGGLIGGLVLFWQAISNWVMGHIK